jgi:hypothetical protein
MNEEISINYELLDAMKKWFIRTIKYKENKYIFTFNAKERVIIRTENYLKRAIWAEIFFDEYVNVSQEKISCKNIFLILDVYFITINTILKLKYWSKQKQYNIWSEMKTEVIRELYLRQCGDISELNQRTCGKINNCCLECNQNYCKKCCAFCNFLDCEKSFGSFAVNIP